MLRRLERALFIVLSVVAGVLVVVIGLIAGGHFVEDEGEVVRSGPPAASEEPPRTVGTTTRAPTQSLPTTTAPATAPTKPTPAPRTTATQPSARPAGRSLLVVAATRGDCWLEVRRGSAAGASLYAGTLLQGHSVRARAVTFWIRFGAAANVDVTIDGSRVDVPTGTADVVLARDARGVRLAAG